MRIILWIRIISEWLTEEVVIPRMTPLPLLGLYLLLAGIVRYIFIIM